MNDCVQAYSTQEHYDRIKAEYMERRLREIHAAGEAA